jgi:hypothetical protein
MMFAGDSAVIARTVREARRTKQSSPFRRSAKNWIASSLLLLAMTAGYAVSLVPALSGAKCGEGCPGFRCAQSGLRLLASPRNGAREWRKG